MTTSRPLRVSSPNAQVFFPGAATQTKGITPGPRVAAKLGQPVHIKEVSVPETGHRPRVVSETPTSAQVKSKPSWLEAVTQPIDLLCK